MADKSFFTDIDYEKDLIACLGDNLGGVPISDIDYIIADGFASSVRYLYKSANVNYDVDALVYPIFYNARHSIESLLKYLIREIKRLDTIKSKTAFNETDEVKKHNGHSLETLYAELCTEASSSDRRINEYIQNKQQHLSLVEYFYFDSKSDSFRYAYDSDGNVNLKGRRQVSVTRIVNVHKDVMDCLNELALLVSSLHEEYKLGIYTSKLSRADLDEIASRLPDSSTWTETIDDAKKEIMKEYSLSSNDFSKAINIIKKDRTLSWKIGAEIQIPFSQQFIELVSEVKPVAQEFYDNTPVIIDFRMGDPASIEHLKKEKAFHDYMKSKCSSLTREDQNLFLAVCEIGSGSGCYGEYFDSYLEYFEKGTYSINDFSSRLIWIATGRFEKGLRICGQPTLLEKFRYKPLKT